MPRIAIVGSRRRNTAEDREAIFALVRRLKDEHGESLHLVSGGAKEGADRFAEEAAFQFDVAMTIHRPVSDPKPQTRFEAVQRLYDRNEVVANDCDELYAQVAPDRTGGTENTLKHLKRRKKTPHLI